jgi:plastocyanin
MLRKWPGALVAVMLVVGACSAQGQPSQNPAAVSPAPTSSAAPSAAASPAGATVEVQVATDTGADLQFAPSEVTVRSAADVRLTFENRSTVPHNLTIQEPINVATSMVVAPGTSETVQFTAPGPGEYAFVCTLHPGMGGRLIVTGG